MLPKCMDRMLLVLVARRQLCSQPFRRMSYHRFELQQPIYDTDYLLDPANADQIEANILLRKGVGDIRLVHELQERLQGGVTGESRRQLADRLQTELGKLPNRTHPRLLSYEGKPRLVRRYNEPQIERATNDHRPHYEFGDICKRMNLYRMEALGNFTGHRSYYLLDELAELEHALIGYTVERLLQEQFRLISVPDLLPARIIESCGMSTTGTRNQVYKVTSGGPADDSRDVLCLSGTSEMALAGYFAGRALPGERLPLRLAAVSRCYRAETSALHEEKGIYRVHQFTKVEMFAICRPDQSAGVLRQFRDIEVSLFEQLGLPFVLLDMPACELGAPAYRKYDIEAWMPGRQMYGEISSCSDCTDYQARRLGIRVDGAQQQPFAHTVNGTACAIPRMLIALLENFQNEDYTVSIPEPLQRHMHGKQVLRRRKVLPELKLTKRLQQEELVCTV
ncbi:seryl-tRNA synthetase [Anopheles darlingi]|uniref:serine--tRNA ligase n=1 Tax=Anopheles darlingi TaxID=43151 RepID=W5JTV7_ANODA|nr:seryl-tRNA synthetase [Anopheles darlingi]